MGCCPGIWVVLVSLQALVTKLVKLCQPCAYIMYFVCPCTSHIRNLVHTPTLPAFCPSMVMSTLMLLRLLMC